MWIWKKTRRSRDPEECSESVRTAGRHIIWCGCQKFTAEKEKLYEKLNTGDRQEAEEAVFAVIIAIASRFGTDGITLSEIFSQRYNYKEK